MVNNKWMNNTINMVLEERWSGFIMCGLWSPIAQLYWCSLFSPPRKIVLCAWFLNLLCVRIPLAIVTGLGFSYSNSDDIFLWRQKLQHKSHTVQVVVWKTGCFFGHICHVCWCMCSDSGSAVAKGLEQGKGLLKVFIKQTNRILFF